jgi:hypothetical protein
MQQRQGVQAFYLHLQLFEAYTFGERRQVSPGDFEWAFGAADHDGEKRQAERVSLCGRTRIDAAQDGHSNAALEQRA